MWKSLKNLLCPPHPDTDPACRAEMEWMKASQAKDGAPGQLILDQGRRVYEENDIAGERIEAKALSLMNACGAFATILVSGAGALKPGPLWPIIPSIVLFCVAMVLLAISRRPTIRTGLPSVRGLLDNFPLPSGQHECWIAATLHQASFELQRLNDWKARLVELATWLACAGVAWFPVVAIIWCVTSS